MATRPELSNLPALTNPTLGKTLFVVEDSSITQTLTASAAAALFATKGNTGARGMSGYSGYSGTNGSGTLTISNVTNNQTYYPIFTSSSAGNISTATVSSSKLTFNPSSGTLTATEINTLSDLSAKLNIQPIENASGIVSQLNGVYFAWKDSGEPSAGLIAQELERAMPSLVRELNGYKTVNYNGVVGLLVEVVKELIEKIAALEK
jgi:hypothetical protein